MICVPREATLGVDRERHFGDAFQGVSTRLGVRAALGLRRGVSEGVDDLARILGDESASLSTIDWHPNRCA
jgi:hypothetical protein